MAPDPTGLSQTFNPYEPELKLTPHGLKEKRRRRAASKVAKASRKRNRA